MTGATFDARPLTDPVDMRAVRAFRSEQRARGRAGGSTAATVIVIVVVAVFAITIVPMVFVPILIGVVSGNLGVGIAGLLPFLLMGAVFVVVVVILVVNLRNGGIHAYRLARFAAANGMEFVGRIDDPPLPGMIFHNGHSRYTDLALRGHRPRFVEFGNYQYTTGSGKNSSTHRWGYIAVKLDVPLPNIVLDALGNNALGSNLPASFSKDQRLSLEGDFDRYFTLYCPEGYERDALYLFTPDIMARFIDHAAQLDVEIVDDWLFLYMQRPVSTIDPATWAWLFGTVGALLTKFDQWARWRDDNLPVAPAAAPPAPGAAAVAASAALPFAPPVGMLTPPPGVAPEGRRLKRGVPWIAIVAFALIAGLWILPQLFGGLMLFFR
ncbi:hypothetical protein DY023_06990 [Microbacterium bovistercoris]|uniref:DUF3137 domain-containing protein n=1 Tax=Microbacterium bovistercoris TaxID=2293570 RepID=A0A371NWH2_9MICO|nr:hypothetical protein [Microbacterium bovistercoris]REJ06212.1 hypothetical protein DY023_06990 [Microbacterium bovistercoris]